MQTDKYHERYTSYYANDVALDIYFEIGKTKVPIPPNASTGCINIYIIVKIANTDNEQ